MSCTGYSLIYIINIIFIDIFIGYMIRFQDSKIPRFQDSKIPKFQIPDSMFYSLPFKNKTTKPSGKNKDVQVRECNLIRMSISPFIYDILLDIRESDKLIEVSESKGYIILRDIESFSCLYFMFSLAVPPP
jgi:hypothetical protein